MASATMKSQLVAPVAATRGRACSTMTGSMSMALTRPEMPARAAQNSPSPQHRSTSTMPGRTPISQRTRLGSGHNTCHQSASGIVVAGKKPPIMRFSRTLRIGILQPRRSSFILIVIELLRALSRVGERKSTGIARVMATYFGARDEFEPVSRDELLDRLRCGAVNLLNMCPGTSSPSRVNPTLMTFRSRGYCIARRPLPTLLGHSAFAVARVFLVARHWLAEVRRNRCLSSSPKSGSSSTARIFAALITARRRAAAAVVA
jgi:hypothetical protein